MGPARRAEVVRESRAQRGLLLEERRRLRHERRDREGDDEKREDEEDREDDGDSEPALDVPLFEPADGRAQRAGHEESDDEHEQDRPEPDQQPEGGDDENERHDVPGRQLEAHDMRSIAADGGGFHRGRRVALGTHSPDSELLVRRRPPVAALREDANPSGRSRPVRSRAAGRRRAGREPRRRPDRQNASPGDAGPEPRSRTRSVTRDSG